MSEEKISLEERFDKLSRILEEMEKPETSLDTSFALYKEGLNEVKDCKEMLDMVEKEMLALNSAGELEAF